MSLKNYLKNIADTLRNWLNSGELINAQNFPEAINSACETQRNEGSNEGYVYGYDEGYWVGEEVGYSDGYNNGREEGYIEGWHIGGLDASPQETVSGEAIGITDIAPIEHNMAVSVRGKNILKYPYYYSNKTLSGITYTDNGDGTITVDGTSTAFTIFELTQQSKMDCSDLFVDGATYKISHTPIGVLMVLGAREISTNKNVYYNSGVTFTVDKSIYKYEWIRIQLNANTTVNNVTVYPMIEEGTTSTSFTPYIEDISTVKLLKQGKNWFNNVAVSQEKNGLTFTVNADKSVTVNGTAETTTYVTLGEQTFEPNTYYLSGCTGGSASTYLLFWQTKTGNNMKPNYNGKTVYNLAETETRRVIIGVYKGATVNNITIYPMVAVSDDVGYEPYIEPTSYTPNADGTVEGVKSLYPSTTLYTDTSGAVIDCTYYQDGKKVKENLIDMILELGGVINE